MIPVDKIALLEGEEIEQGREVSAVVNLVSDEGSTLLRFGLHDAVGHHPGAGLGGVAHLERIAAIVYHDGVTVGGSGHCVHLICQLKR